MIRKHVNLNCCDHEETKIEAVEIDFTRYELAARAKLGNINY